MLRRIPFPKIVSNIGTSDFQSEVGEVFGEIGGELPAKFGRRFSSFFCWENRQKNFPPKLHRKFHHQTSLRGSGLWQALQTSCFVWRFFFPIGAQAVEFYHHTMRIPSVARIAQLRQGRLAWLTSQKPGALTSSEWPRFGSVMVTLVWNSLIERGEKTPAPPRFQPYYPKNLFGLFLAPKGYFIFSGRLK